MRENRKRVGAQTIPKMSLARYLELIRPIRKLKRFHLVNQDVRGGMVYFRGPAAMRRLTEIVRFHNTGELPSEVAIKGQTLVSDTTVSKDTPNIYMHRALLEDLRGPDSEGWYTSRCPTCAWKGDQVGQKWDDDSTHFRFRETGQFYCHANCEAFEVFRWLEATLADADVVLDASAPASPDLELRKMNAEFDDFAKTLEESQ